MILNELLDKIEHKDYRIEGLIEFKSIVTDSRLASSGSLFFAIKGRNKDGNDFIEQAIGRGVVAVISDMQMGKNFPINYIQVKDTRATLARISKLFYRCPDEGLRIVGITGTNGKTTVSMLSQYLMGGQECVGLIGTVRYDIGKRTLPSHRTTPESLDCFQLFSNMVESKCRDAVIEVSSHGIDQRRLDLIKMKAVVFLNLSRDHIDYHKNMKEYFSVKKKLFSGVLGNNPEFIIINRDCKYGLKLEKSLKGNKRIISFSIKSKSDFRASNICLESNRTSFVLNHPHGKVNIQSNLLGRYNVYNILAAITITQSLGYDLENMIERIKEFKGVPGRMEKIEEGQEFSVLIDYAHTADAISNACEMLSEVTMGKKIVLIGCGGNRDRGKRSLMMKAAVRGADLIIATADNPRYESLDNIFNDMKKGVGKKDLNKVLFIDDRKQAISKALKSAKKGDCVLIAGKGHEVYQEINGTMIPFDDRKTSRELIRNCLGGNL